MKFGFNILFFVNFRHSYFENEIPNCFSVEPTSETSLILRNNSFIFKQKESSFLIAFESSNKDVTRTRDSIISDTDTLKFIVKLNDPLLFNYTSVETDNILQRIFYFHNRITNNQLLHAGEFVQENDLVAREDVASELFVKPFAVIEIQLSKVKTEQYFIRFKEKASYWRYLLVSDHLKTLTNPAIINPFIQFNGPKEIVLPNNVKAVSFVSDIPISIKQRAEKQFQLVENYDRSTQKGKVIIRNLPHPNVNIISKLGTDQDVKYSEIII
jgi:hypothetical protein